jgi:ATP-dependent Clp protease adaptor protein ClpS
MDYVVFVFQTLLGMNRAKATKHMLEVHETGRSLVASTDREQAEHFVTRLHLYGLQATLEKADAS